MSFGPISGIEPQVFNQALQGFYGEFGSGANSQIYFLQTGLKPSALEKITLISDIPGSECWPVRALFQRDVDTKRVGKQILPYLQSLDKTKFFNPLTLTLLPIDPETNQIITDIPSIDYELMEQGGNKWNSLVRGNFYRYRYVKDQPQYGLLEWNDNKVKVVAIDGQHRLSALKNFQKDVANNPERFSSFMKWTIPVVIFGMRKIDENKPIGTILDVIRNVFVYINTTAKKPNRTRTILLSDESINDICTQELLQVSHKNDISEIGKRIDTRLPLLFYDWRGEEYEGTRVYSPAYIKSTEEINDWFINYLLGEDFSVDQEIALGIQPDDDLHAVFVNKKLDTISAQKIRDRFKEYYIEGLLYFLENFTPYNSYITELRRYEKELNEESVYSRHAFYQLRFGSNTAGEDIQKDIRSAYDIIVKHLVAVKEGIFEEGDAGLLGYDIGMRGIIFALKQFYQYYCRTFESHKPWLDYCKWFTDVINRVNSNKWFDMSTQNKDVKYLLTHIVQDHNDKIVNYRFDDVKNAFGPFLTILVGAYGKKSSDVPSEEVWNEVWDNYTEVLSNTLLKGYRRQVKTLLKELGQLIEGTPEFKKKNNEEALKRTEKHINKLEKYINQIS